MQLPESRHSPIQSMKCISGKGQARNGINANRANVQMQIEGNSAESKGLQLSNIPKRTKKRVPKNLIRLSKLECSVWGVKDKRNKIFRISHPEHINDAPEIPF